MKEYGLRLTDALGATYTRWFNSDGVYKSIRGISTELLQLGRQFDEMSLKRAIKHCETNNSGVCYEVLYENDFKNNNNE